MITKKEVKHIAKLARLGLSEKEEEKLAKEFPLILDYVEKLKKADLSKAKPAGYFFKSGKKSREDEPAQKPGSKREKLLNLAPETKNGCLKVKLILK